MKRFIYEIAGFIPPKEHSFSGNDFSIDLSADFARTCLKSKIDEKTREYFMTMAAGMARITQVANPLAIRCETFEETLLLKTINLGTN